MWFFEEHLPARSFTVPRLRLLNDIKRFCSAPGFDTTIKNSPIVKIDRPSGRAPTADISIFSEEFTAAQEICGLIDYILRHDQSGVVYR